MTQNNTRERELTMPIETIFFIQDYNVRKHPVSK